MITKCWSASVAMGAAVTVNQLVICLFAPNRSVVVVCFLKRFPELPYRMV